MTPPPSADDFDDESAAAKNVFAAQVPPASSSSASSSGTSTSTTTSCARDARRRRRQNPGARPLQPHGVRRPGRLTAPTPRGALRLGGHAQLLRAVAAGATQLLRRQLHRPTGPRRVRRSARQDYARAARRRGSAPGRLGLAAALPRCGLRASPRASRVGLGGTLACIRGRRPGVLEEPPDQLLRRQAGGELRRELGLRHPAARELLPVAQELTAARWVRSVRGKNSGR